MNNAAYWKKRFRQLESARHASDGKRYLECEELFTAALRELNEQINAWFGRFARNNGVTLEDARKLLTKSELAELKWDVKQYIKAGEANALTGEFERQLENASAKYHISRLEAIKLQVQMECERLYGNLTDEIDDHIRSQYLDAYYHTAYEIDRGFGVGHTLEAINTDKLESIVSKPWAADGKNFATRLGESKVKLINNVHASLTQMCMNGNNPDKAIAQLAKTMNGDKVRAGRIIMTESAYFAQEAQRKCFSELGVEEYEIVATLDNRTCDGTCQGEDGKHYPMKMFEAGVTAPPFHPNCRCCTAPYFDDDDGARIAKDADGKNYTVSSDMTYPQWKKEFVNQTTYAKALRIKDVADLKKYTSSDIINMQSVDEIKSYFKQAYSIDVVDFEKQDLFSVQSVLSGFDDMLKEFPETLGGLNRIIYSPHLKACGQIDLAKKIAKVGNAGLGDYGTGIHEVSHLLDYRRTMYAKTKGFTSYAEYVTETARKNVHLRKNTKEYRDMLFRIAAWDKDKPEELFAYAMESEKGGNSNILTQEIYSLVKKGVGR